MARMRLFPLTALTLALTAAAACSDPSAAPHDGGAKPDTDAGKGGGGGDAGPETPPRTWTRVPPLFIGSGGFGFSFGSCFVGATAPQGLAKVGPDTTGPWGDVNFLHYSGYWYGDDTIQGF